jgi:hypothetical protein
VLEKAIASLTSPTFGFLLKLFAGLTTAAFGILGLSADGPFSGRRSFPSGNSSSTSS